MLWVRLLAEEADDVVLEVLRLHFGKEGLDHAALLVDEKLCKVPRHLAAPESVAGLEKLPDRVGSGTIDLDLAEHGESHAVLGRNEFLDLALAELSKNAVAGAIVGFVDLDELVLPFVFDEVVPVATGDTSEWMPAAAAAASAA